MSESLNFTDPYTGEVVQFKESRKKDAIKAGYLPSTLSEVIEHKKEETYGGTIGTIGTGVLSGLSEGTFGLSDYALTRGGVILPEELRDLRTINPNADMGGKLIGGITSMAVGGTPLSLLAKGSAKVGAKVAAKTARALGKSGTTAIPRLAGGLAREGTLGAGIGLGGGISDIALTPEYDTAQAASHLFSSTARGAGFGAGLGSLAFAGRVGADKVVRKFTNGTEQLKKLRSEKTVLTAEIDALKSGNAPASKIEAATLQMEAVESSIKQQQSEIMKTVFHRAVGMGIGSAMGGGIGSATLGFLVAPKAINLIGRAVAPIGVKIKGAVKGSIEDIAEGTMGKFMPVIKRIEGVAEKIGPAVKKVEGVAGKISPAVKRVESAISMITPAVERVESVAGKITPAIRRVEDAAGRISPMIQRTEDIVSEIRTIASEQGGRGLFKRAVGKVSDQTVGRAARKANDIKERIREKIIPNFDDIDDFYTQPKENTIVSDLISDAVEAQSGKAADTVRQAVGGSKSSRFKVPVAEVDPIKAGIHVEKEGAGDIARDVIAESAGHATGKALGYLAKLDPEKVLTGIAAGGAEGLLFSLGSHFLEQKGKDFFIGKITDALKRKIIPAGKRSIISELSDSDILDSVRGISELDPDIVSLSVLSNVPQAPQETVSAIVDRVVKANSYVQRNLPPEGSKSVTGNKSAIRKIKAVIDPESLLRDFANGRMNREQIAAWEEVYPEALAHLRAIVSSEVARVEADGDKYTTRQKNQIGMLLGNKKMYDPKAVAMMQEMHRANTESKIKSKRGRVNLSGEHQTTTQRIRGN